MWRSFKLAGVALLCYAVWIVFEAPAKTNDNARGDQGLSAAAAVALADDTGPSEYVRTADAGDADLRGGLRWERLPTIVTDEPDEGEPRVVPRQQPRGTSFDEPADRIPLHGAPQIDDAASEQRPSVGTPLPPELEALRDKIRTALSWYYPRHLNTRDNSPWEVMHGIIAYGVNTQLFRGSPQGDGVNAISWMCSNRPCEGERIFDLGLDGRIVARRGPGLQGHGGQLLAILAQSHVKSDYPLIIGGKNFTIEDLIEEEKMDCHVGEELTFKLIGLSHYLDSDAKWTTRDGENWSIERLVQEELKAPIVRNAACGGTHRLMGFSYSLNKRIKAGKPVVGQFRRAQAYLNDYHRYTFSLQNSDGSFSTEWFARGGANPDVDRRLKTSGHILEWISFSLSDDELRQPRMIKAADYLATILLQDKNRTWEIGPLGHGLHALVLYDRRVFAPAEASQSVAELVP